MAEATEAQAVDQAAPEAQAVPDSISLNDLGLLLNIVDLASKRGAFQGAELSQVGAIFDKLNAFLTFVAEQQTEQAQEAAGEEEAAAEE
jgi:hypothetical protein